MFSPGCLVVVVQEFVRPRNAAAPHSITPGNLRAYESAAAGHPAHSVDDWDLAEEDGCYPLPCNLPVNETASTSGQEKTWSLTAERPRSDCTGIDMFAGNTFWSSLRAVSYFKK
jgi:hypothetical protein